MRNLMAEKEKLEKLEEKQPTASTSSLGSQNRERSPLGKPFKDPFAFIFDMHNSIQGNEKLINDADQILGDFLINKISANNAVEKMKLLLENKPDIISGLKLFLGTPAAVSSVRADFKDASILMHKVAIRFGKDSEEYHAFCRILKTSKNNISKIRSLDKQLDELFKNETNLKSAVKEYLKQFRSSVEREMVESD